MASRLARFLPPILLLVIGVAVLTYGAGFNQASVSFEDEVVPPTPPPSVMFRPSSGRGSGMPPFMGAPKPPPPQPVIVLRTVEEPERNLVLEATRGGVALRDGRIFRTYSGAPPSGCPT